MNASKTPPVARRAAGFLLPLLVTLVVAALSLRLLDALPAYWQAWTTSRSAPPVLAERLEYPTIEEAERGLGVRIALPSYFPSYLRWPPDTIRGQRDPVKVASILFLSSDGRQALQIRELFWPGEEMPLLRPGAGRGHPAHRAAIRGHPRPADPGTGAGRHPGEPAPLAGRGRPPGGHHHLSPGRAAPHRRQHPRGVKSAAPPVRL